MASVPSKMGQLMIFDRSTMATTERVSQTAIDLQRTVDDPAGRKFEFFKAFGITQEMAKYEALDQARKHLATAEILPRIKHPDFPEELVLQVLHNVVAGDRERRLYLNGGVDIERLARHNLLVCSDESLSGLAELAILDAATFKITPAFIRGIDGGKEYLLPKWLAGRAQRVRHLILRVKVHIRACGSFYPTQIYQLVEGMASLASHFPQLKSCLLRIVFDISEGADRAHALDIAQQGGCRKGFSRMSDMDTEMRVLLKEFGAHGPGKYKSLRFEYSYSGGTDIGCLVCLPRLPPTAPTSSNTSSNEEAETAEAKLGEVLKRARVHARYV